MQHPRKLSGGKGPTPAGRPTPLDEETAALPQVDLSPSVLPMQVQHLRDVA